MDSRSALLSIIDGPFPVLTPAELDDIIDRYFNAFRPLNDVDGKKLMKALAMIESSGGRNCQPRHEESYCTGVYSKNPTVIRLTQLYGHAAHASYGMWQLMFVNCPPVMAPSQMRNANDCARATADFIVRQNIRFRPQSVEEWGRTWNGGNPKVSNKGVDAYVSLLQHYYDTVS